VTLEYYRDGKKASIQVTLYALTRLNDFQNEASRVFREAHSFAGGTLGRCH
jgi:hypothetical protein